MLLVSRRNWYMTAPVVSCQSLSPVSTLRTSSGIKGITGHRATKCVQAAMDSRCMSMLICLINCSLRMWYVHPFLTDAGFVQDFGDISIRRRDVYQASATPSYDFDQCSYQDRNAILWTFQGEVSSASHDECYSCDLCSYLTIRSGCSQWDLLCRLAQISW